MCDHIYEYYHGRSSGDLLVYQGVSLHVFRAYNYIRAVDILLTVKFGSPLEDKAILEINKLYILNRAKQYFTCGQFMEYCSILRVEDL